MLQESLPVCRPAARAIGKMAGQPAELKEKKMNTFVVSTSGPAGQIPIGVFLAIAVSFVAQAQSPTADDFNPSVGGAPLAIAIQADGKVLVGGGPSIAANQALVRLNADGTMDTTFVPGVSDTVNTLVV